MEHGLVIKQGEGLTRVEMCCPHQRGLLYIVPSEGSWVCSPEHLHAHALAGFLKELVALDSPEVRGLMQRWGLYFRERPLEEGSG